MRLLLSLVLLSTLCMIPLTGWAGSVKEVPEVGVRTLMQAPEQYSHQIKVSGVVSQVAEDAKNFGLIDLAEYKDCNKVTCASLVLPVHWGGSMPDIAQKVAVTGEIKKEGERYLFIASELTPLSPQ